MKKLTAVILAGILLLCLCACGGQKLDNETSGSDSSQPASDDLIVSTEETTEKLGENVYDSVEKFEYLDVDGGIAIVEFRNSDRVAYDKIIIPSEIDGKKVVSIGRRGHTTPAITSVYGNCEVVIPDTVTYIAKRAFSGASGLARLSGGENCVEIGDEAFINCSSLTKVDFIDHVKTIGEGVFIGTPLLEETDA